MPIGEMSKRLGVTAPTIRSRIKNLEKKGLLKVSGIIDPNQHPQMTTALVAMRKNGSNIGKNRPPAQCGLGRSLHRALRYFC
jgi:DNA-binding Lrp family transcriptional regulator